jgi:hypothetical protein
LHGKRGMLHVGNDRRRSFSRQRDRPLHRRDLRPQFVLNAFPVLLNPFPAFALCAFPGFVLCGYATDLPPYNLVNALR